ncbi:hypothetical protein GY45DRAFT_1104176 [Cubamyces sp. BRFM 1775]|nr:hypothetical protein GY45DRAFT_1104176 [Cubamyces sp. BRFM 1775]
MMQTPLRRPLLPARLGSNERPSSAFEPSRPQPVIILPRIRLHHTRARRNTVLQCSSPLAIEPQLSSACASTNECPGGEACTPALSPRPAPRDGGQRGQGPSIRAWHWLEGWWHAVTVLHFERSSHRAEYIVRVLPYARSRPSRRSFIRAFIHLRRTHDPRAPPGLAYTHPRGSGAGGGGGRPERLDRLGPSLSAQGDASPPRPASRPSRTCANDLVWGRGCAPTPPRARSVPGAREPGSQGEGAFAARASSHLRTRGPKEASAPEGKLASLVGRHVIRRARAISKPYLSIAASPSVAKGSEMATTIAPRARAPGAPETGGRTLATPG